MQDHSSQSGLHRVLTGIPGLDTVLGGGLLSGSLNVIAGEPGTGKTVLGNQFAFNRAKSDDKVIYLTLLAESHGRLLAHMRTFGFFNEYAVPANIFYVSGYRVLETEALTGLLSFLQRMIRERDAKILVVDGLATAEDFAVSPTEYKKFLHELQFFTVMTDCTTLLLTIPPASGTRVEFAIADGLLTITNDMFDLRMLRELQVLKLRGSAYLEGQHVCDIGDDGMTVFPRLETMAYRRVAPEHLASGRAAFGYDGIDRMLGGGLPAGTATLLIGPPGSGKTALGLAFLSAGADAGERGVYLGFSEPPVKLRQSARSTGLALEDHEQAGALNLLWYPPYEHLLDSIATDLLATLDAVNAKRLVLDGLGGFMESAAHHERVGSFLESLLHELFMRQVSVISIDHAADPLAAPRAVAPAFKLSHDNIVVLAYETITGEFRRYLNVIKMLGSDFDHLTRSFRITSTGFEVDLS